MSGNYVSTERTIVPEKVAPFPSGYYAGQRVLWAAQIKEGRAAAERIAKAAELKNRLLLESRNTGYAKLCQYCERIMFRSAGVSDMSWIKQKVHKEYCRAARRLEQECQYRGRERLRESRLRAKMASNTMFKEQKPCITAGCKGVIVRDHTKHSNAFIMREFCDECRDARTKKSQAKFRERYRNEKALNELVQQKLKEEVAYGPESI